MAFKFEGASLDPCAGHSSPDSQYHYHAVRTKTFFINKENAIYFYLTKNTKMTINIKSFHVSTLVNSSHTQLLSLEKKLWKETHLT